MMTGIGGIAFTAILLWMTSGNPNVIMIGVFGGIITFMPLIMMILTAKNKNLIQLFFNLQEENGIKKEKFLLYPGKFGRLGITIARIVSDKVLFVKGAGLIDDKGTEYAFGNSPLSLWNPGSGFTLNVLSAQYHGLLKKDEKRLIQDYDEMIKVYLTDKDYDTFVKTFRLNNPEPDSAQIDREIQWLKDVQNPRDKLELPICGETYSIQDDLAFMKYNYHPQTMKNFLENEKINVRREEMGYRDKDKAMSWAKAIAVIVIAIVILLAVLSSLDLSGLGGIFGGA
jgi:hypothetical protein